MLAEKEAWEERVIGVSFDGTGYGDDGSIWGGEFFPGSMTEGFHRVMHLRTARLPAEMRRRAIPCNARLAFYRKSTDLPALSEAPFHFPRRYQDALQLIDKNIRTFETTSIGRLFDAAAALLGFTREISFEGQAAMWLEQLARTAGNSRCIPVSDRRRHARFPPAARGRGRGSPPWQASPPQSLAPFSEASPKACAQPCGCYRESEGARTTVLSGGVFQNEMLLR